MGQYAVGAIHRLAVRKGISRDDVERLLATRTGLAASAAKQLAAHWFSQQFRHGGIAYFRDEYLQRRKAFGAEGLRPAEAPAT